MSEFEPKDELPRIMAEIEQLPVELGFNFNITKELRCIKSKATELLRKFPDHINMTKEVIDIMTEYQSKGEKIVDAKEIDADRIKALLGHQIDRICLLVESNWDKDFIIIEINEAISNAHDEKFDVLKRILLNFKDKL